MAFNMARLIPSLPHDQAHFHLVEQFSDTSHGHRFARAHSLLPRGGLPHWTGLLDRAIKLTRFDESDNHRKSDQLDKAMMVISKLHAIKSDIEQESKTKYTHTDHKDLLIQLWNGFVDDDEKSSVPEIPSPSWKQLGFQGNDPATDFRGMGIFGLNQMITFCDRHPVLAKTYYREAQVDSNWFFPVLFGINVTGFVHEMLMRGDLDVALVSDYKAPMRTCVDNVFVELYRQLCDKWLSMEELDAMHFPYMFNQVKTDYMDKLKLAYH